MPQTIIGMYLSLITWTIIIFSIYYFIMKKYILINIRNKLILRNLSFSYPHLIVKANSGIISYPIFLS